MEKEILVKMNDEALDLIKNIFNPKEYSKYQREANAMEAVSEMLNTVLIDDERERKAFQKLLMVIVEYTELLGIISKIQIFMQNTKKMETVSKKNEAETEDVRILREETKKALKTLYSIGTDAEEFKALPLSESTRAAIYARRKVSDALESLFVLHRIMYCVDDEESANKILEAARGMENIANEYIIASIEDKMGVIGKEI